jgi:UDP-GlcNAc:undecaprenyl-phosphate/decaprenyl-phosphate GlcNAc-1-phosphate transferase
VLRLVGPAAASFGLCLLAILALRPLAIAVDLIDRPGGRKNHQGDVPIVGGLAMFLGIALGIGLLPGSMGDTYLAACAILVTIGLVDDRFELSPWTRLPGQISAAIVVVGTGVMVTTIGDPFGIGTINFSGWSAIGFTLLITTAAINGFNMLDGMDGLAGTTALTSCLALGFLAWTGGLIEPAATSLVLAAAVSAFLIFNLPTRFNRPMRCFMGDAGSTLLGFSVALICIQVSQSPAKAASPVTTLWTVALPLYELVWSTLRRLLRGVSPFKADTNHFHHLLQKAGFGVRGAFAVFAILTVALAVIGIVTELAGVPQHYSLLLLLLAGVGVVSLMHSADVLWKLVPDSLRRLPPLDSGAKKTTS